MRKGRIDTGEQRAVARLLADARTGAPLTAAEEQDLARKVRSGDTGARDELVRRNLPLVVTFVRTQPRGSVRLDELVQEGNLGLLRAVEKFDPDAGTRFSTYAIWWIRAYVWKHLKQARSAVRPRSGTVAPADASLDAALDEDGETTYLERLEDEGQKPDERVADAEGEAQVRGALERVRARIGELGWDIIHTRLEQDPPDTLEQIGRRWGVSRERVRQVELSTKRFLRGYLEELNEKQAA
jgi:RNA polymerase primary sigma factor